MTVERWEGDSFLNFLFNVDGGCKADELEVIQDQLGKMHRKAHEERPIAWHKRVLGRQNYTWNGEFRFWVWESENWRVYVSDKKGVCFEPRVGLSRLQAIEAWEDYRKKMGLQS